MGSVAGGCINDANRVALDGGGTVFVKSHRHPPAGFYAAEVHGLEWLREAPCVRVPKVLAWSDKTPAFLVLEDLGDAPRTRGFDGTLGRMLASLHRACLPRFGLDRPNYLATLSQENSATDDWAEFYIERRLRPQLRRAVDGGAVPGGWTARFEGVFRRMEALVGPVEPPARLHGDLWGGNVHTTLEGTPCLIDPAVAGGHREMDLAMLALFGNPFGKDFEGAYRELYPLAAGASGRVPLWQLYPLLTHVVLFGGSYVPKVNDALRRVE